MRPTSSVLPLVHREDLPQGFAMDRFAHQPYLKNLVPHTVVYSCCRLQDTWLDK